MRADIFTREEIEQVETGGGTPVWEHWSEFTREWRLCGRSESSIANVRDTIRLFAIHGGMWTLESWMNTKAAFETAHKLRIERGWSSSSFNSYRKNVNTYFKWLADNGEIDGNPITRIKKRKEAFKNYPIPAKEDFEKIFSYVENRSCTNEMQRRRDVLFFRLLKSTGARPVELLNLRLENVEDRKHVRIDGAKIGGRPRAYPLHESVLSDLQNYIREVANLNRSSELQYHLFLGVKGNSPWTYSGVRKLFERLNAESGLDKPLTCYSFRRHAATSLYREGMPLERISKYLGHSRTSTTMRYIQNLPELNREAVEMLMN